MQLALDPDRVRSDAATAGNVRELAALMPVLRREGVRAVSPNGVLGDPTGASAQEGARLIAAATDDLCAAVAAWVGR